MSCGRGAATSQKALGAFVRVVSSASGELLCQVPAERAVDGLALRQAVSELAAVPLEEQRLLWNGAPLGCGPLPPALWAGESVFPVRLLQIPAEWHEVLNRVSNMGGGSVDPVFLDDGPFVADTSLLPSDLELLKTRHFVLKAVQENGAVLRLAPEEMLGDREVVLAAVRQSGSALAFAAPALRGDAEVVQVALSEDVMALEFASAALQRDRGMALRAVEGCGQAYLHVNEECRLDREISLAAVRRCGTMMKNVPFALLKDRSFILEAVRANGEALLHLPPKLGHLRTDKELVAAARDFWAGRGVERLPVTIPLRAEHFLCKLPPPAKPEERRAVC